MMSQTCIVKQQNSPLFAKELDGAMGKGFALIRGGFGLKRCPDRVEFL
jgi:hypothetical protein